MLLHITFKAHSNFLPQSINQHEIRKNPTFRKQFLLMCTTVTVDPVAYEFCRLAKDFGQQS
ncbi:hypothetical protein T11_13258 [Trichinella zimbabwensis]|uniref:Uncharacterized protein n=1 Tax=Trichinella zimbabwensis TaxID=268475 RepID=A0A0V1HQA2_9BILA|nr:hypothetical protein T11_13258 [Trichinella zimbabwensis]